MTETSLLCKACGSDAIPRGSNFCPQCGSRLSEATQTNHHHQQQQEQIATAFVVEHDTPVTATPTTTPFSVAERVSVPVSSVIVDETTSPAPHPASFSNTTTASTYPGATFWKHPTRDMIQHAKSVDAMGGILFLIVNPKKGGKFTVPRVIHAQHILTGSKLDLSRADFVYPQTTIYVGTILGGFHVTVPRGVRVDTQGLGILGAVQGLGSQTVHAGQDAPRVLLQGLAILGGVKVTVNMDVPPVEVIG